jgi:hypothetical protein
MAKSRTFGGFKTAYMAGRLLDIKMPDDRILRDCTADHCMAYGGWLEEVGWRIHHGWSTGDDQIDHAGTRKVSDIFDEAMLQCWFLMSHARDLQCSYFEDYANEITLSDELDGGHFR